MGRRVQELKCWEIRILQICVYDTPLEVDSRRMHFLIEAKSLLSNPGKMIGEQYRIKDAIMQTIPSQCLTEIHIYWLKDLADRVHKNDFNDKSEHLNLLYKYRPIKKTRCEDSIDMSGPGHVRGKMYTRILK